MRGLFITALCAGKALNRLPTCPKVCRRPRSSGEQQALWGRVLPSLCWGSPRLSPAESAVRTAQGPNIWLMVQETCQNPLGEAADPGSSTSISDTKVSASDQLLLSGQLTPGEPLAALG